MGVESFYLQVVLQDGNFDSVKKIIDSNGKYKELMGCYVNEELHAIDFNAGLISFFPICEIIFDLCKKLNRLNPVEDINSRKVSRRFDFKDSMEFFAWMHKLWQEKLAYFHQEWGAFIISPSNYYKARRKLRKRYFTTYSLEN